MTSTEILRNIERLARTLQRDRVGFTDEERERLRRAYEELNDLPRPLKMSS